MNAHALNMKLWIPILISLLLSGCHCNRPIVSETVHDVQTVTELLRDTVVVLAPDSAIISLLMECDENHRVAVRQLNDYRAGAHMQPPRVVIRDNILTATARVDSMSIYLTLKDRYRTEAKTVTVTETRTEYVKVRGLFWWAGVLSCMAATVLAGLKLWKIKH